MAVRQELENGLPSEIRRKTSFRATVPTREFIDFGNGQQPILGYDTPGDESGLKNYLRSSSEEPLLTAEEEIELAKTIEAGKDAEEAKDTLSRYRFSFPELRPEINAQLNDSGPGLDRSIDAAEQARDRFIKANTRLVVSIAKRYQNRGLPLDDLIQEGNIGLMTAVDKYDWREGNRFSTHAVWWIRQEVYRATIDQGNNIRLPVHVSEFVNRLAKIYAALTQELGREPNTEELAKQCAKPEGDIQIMLSAAQKTVSLELPIGEEEDGCFGDMIEDRSKDTAEEAIGNCSQQKTQQKAGELLSALNERQRQILELRYGFYGRELSLDKIGKRFGLTRERIRQIEKEALDILRSIGRGEYSEDKPEE